MQVLAKPPISCKSQNVPRMLKLPRSPWDHSSQTGDHCFAAKNERLFAPLVRSKANKHPQLHALIPIPRCQTARLRLRFLGAHTGCQTPSHIFSSRQCERFTVVQQKYSFRSQLKKKKYSTSLTPFNIKSSGWLCFEYLQPQICWRTQPQSCWCPAQRKEPSQSASALLPAEKLTANIHLPLLQ